MSEPVSVPLKRCNLCGIRKDFSEFGALRLLRKDGTYHQYIQSYCKECKKKYMQGYHQKRRETDNYGM